MGADLCGYLLKGPVKLSRSKVQKAKKLYAELRAHLEDAPEKFEEFAYKWAKNLTRSAGNCSPNSSLGAFFDELQKSVRVMDPQLVDKFVEMWTKHRYRDMARRVDPDDKTQQLVFVGGQVWGDEPESDSAWGLVANMDEVGLLNVIGVR